MQNPQQFQAILFILKRVKIHKKNDDSDDQKIKSLGKGRCNDIGIRILIVYSAFRGSVYASRSVLVVLG